MVGQARPEYPGSVESQAPSMGGPGALMNGQLPGFVPARTPEPGAMVLRGISLAPPGMPVVRRLDLGSALVPECNPVAVPVTLAGPMNMPEEGLGDPGAEVPRAGTVISARQG